MLRVPRVAFFTDSFHEANGVALTSREFAKFSKGRFFPFFSVHAGPETQHWKRGCFETFELGASRARFAIEHDLSFDLLFHRHLRNLERALRHFQPDVMHVTGPGHVGMLGAILGYRLGIPLVASWHTNVHEFGARRLAKLLSGLPSFAAERIVSFAERRSLDLTVRFYELARMIFAPNPELCEMLSTRTRRPVHAMHRGIDCDLFRPDRREHANQKFVIGHVGRISTEKNVRMLVSVEDALRRRGFDSYEFHIVGEGSERPWLERNLKRAVFLGVLKGESLADAYAQFDALLFPSETDTFGNVVLEAGASGVPVLVSASGGPKYLVDDGVSGFVATCAEQYTDGILKLARSARFSEDVGLAARAQALSRSWDRVFEDLYGHYQQGIACGILRTAPPRSRTTAAKTFPARTVS